MGASSTLCQRSGGAGHFEDCRPGKFNSAEYERKPLASSWQAGLSVRQ